MSQVNSYNKIWSAIKMNICDYIYLLYADKLIEKSRFTVFSST